MSEPETIRILITGSRDWACRPLADSVMARLLTRYGTDLVIVHGGAPGVDLSFDAAAKGYNVPTEPHPARWDDLTVLGAVVRRRRGGTFYNANAGPIRNAEMVRAGAKFCLAVHKNLKSSKGTQGCVRLALAAEIPVWLIDNEDGMTRQITKEDLA